MAYKNPVHGEQFILSGGLHQHGMDSGLPATGYSFILEVGESTVDAEGSGFGTVSQVTHIR